MCKHFLLGAGAAMTDGSKRVADENQNQLTGEKRIVDEAFGMVDEHLLEALRKRIQTA